MKITQIDDVELISIKTKSLEDFDNELNFNLKAKSFNKNEYDGSRNDFKANTRDTEYDVFNGGDQEQEEEDNDHYQSSVRFLTIDKSPNGACGFHLTRTKWDPYPWVSAVDNFTPAAKSDLKTGDCVLEVNGCDVLGLRITDIAKLVKSSHHQVTLLLWSSNCNAKCDKENLCAAPMPRSLQRLSLVVQTILSLIECPVCLDTITPPAMQCQNGHLLCVDCRIRAEKCPVCRDRYFPRPALIAEQIQSAITSAFNLCRNEDKVRQKVFGRHTRQRQMVRATLAGLQQQQQQKDQQQHKSLRENPLIEDEETNTTNTAAEAAETVTAIHRNVSDKSLSVGSSSSSTRNRTTCNKLFTKLLNSKAYSMENLTNIQSCIGASTANSSFNTCQTTIKSAISQFDFFDTQQQQQKQHHSPHEPVAGHRALFKDFELGQQQQQQKASVTNTNQFYDSPRNVARIQHFLSTHVSTPQLDSTENDFHLNTNLCCRQTVNNKMKHFSLSSDKEFAKSKENITCILDSSIAHLNNESGISSPEMVCEASNATVPRAIRLIDKH